MPYWFSIESMSTFGFGFAYCPYFSAPVARAADGWRLPSHYELKRSQEEINSKGPSIDQTGSKKDLLLKNHSPGSKADFIFIRY